MLLIGTDEAGYGPNLGPLVVALTAWTVPDSVSPDLWDSFAGIVSQTADRTGTTIQIADSKQVHSASAGIEAIERSARAILQLADIPAVNFGSLCSALTGRDVCGGSVEICFQNVNLPLPIVGVADGDLIETWRSRCETLGIRLQAVACRVLFAAEFNAGLEERGGKGRLLSETTLELLSRHWSPAQRAVIHCDKHGGRNRYADLLANAFAGEFPRCLQESRASSRYRLGAGELEFCSGAERHLPVAAASIVAKYVRELSMEAFNRYWQTRLPGVRPTKGYPVDARRFLAQLEPLAQEEGISRDTYWRRQ